MPYPSRYQQVFPGFPPLEFDPTTLGFVNDVSWQHEVCPAFETEDNMLRLWVNYPDPDEREVTDAPRFRLDCKGPDEEFDPLTLYAGETLDPVQQLLRLPFVHQLREGSQLQSPDGLIHDIGPLGIVGPDQKYETLWELLRGFGMLDLVDTDRSDVPFL